MGKAAWWGVLAFVVSLPACGSSPPPPAAAPSDAEARPATPDAKAEASRHFKAGMTKVAAKDFDGGIAELQEAMRILPHPNTLYNIAKAHDDAGHKDEALRHYRDYVATNPDDRASVEARMKQLQAK